MVEKQNICIITSAIGGLMGVVPIEDRYHQTLAGIESVRKKLPDSIIILNDVSVLNVDHYRNVIKSKVDIFMDSCLDTDAMFLSQNQRKSQSELVIFKSSLEYVANNFDLSKVNRIFKLTGRSSISEEFDIDSYDDTTKNKYVFKKSVQSYLSSDMRLYETRFWSMDVSLISDYLQKWPYFFQNCNNFDIEHSYYQFLNRNDVIEFENIWVEGVSSRLGNFIKD
jgi:hypothetical protein